MAEIEICFIFRIFVVVYLVSLSSSLSHFLCVCQDSSAFDDILFASAAAIAIVQNKFPGYRDLYTYIPFFFLGWLKEANQRRKRNTKCDNERKTINSKREKNLFAAFALAYTVECTRRRKKGPPIPYLYRTKGK